MLGMTSHSHNTPIATHKPESNMNTITVENKGIHLIVRFNNGAPRRMTSFSVTEWREKRPGYTIIIDGVVNDYGL
jgi:hypothetical protein